MNYDAGDLLDLMRFDVEGILLECRTMFGDEMPTAPSQSHRANRALSLIACAATQARAEGDKTRLFRLYKMRNRLERFLAVHETVRILEMRDRDPWGLDCFGFDIPKKEEENA